MSDQKKTPPLLKKSQIIRVLNISAKEFERRLAEGHFPRPFVWVTDTPRGRRWHPDAIFACFGVDIAA